MRRRSGQAMLIAILTLGGAILGATSIAGLLLLYQIRSTTDSENSAKAIFAADAGINWALYDDFQWSGPDNAPLPGSGGGLGGGVEVQVNCFDANNNDLHGTWSCNSTANGGATSSYAVSEGTSNGSRRAFLAYLATSTFP